MLVYNIIGTALEMLIKVFYCHRTAGKKKYGIKEILVVIVLFTVHLLALRLKSQIINVALSFLSVFVMLIVVYKTSIKRAFATSIMFPLAIYIADIITTIILENIINKNYGAIPSDEMGYVMGMCMSDTILFVAILYISGVLSKKLRDLKIRYWIFITLCPVISCVILIMIDYLLVQAQNADTSMMYIPIIGLAYINFMVCSFFETYAENIKLNMIKKLAEQNMENYRILETSEKEYRMLRHDIQNHIRVMTNMLANNKTEETRKYLKSMEDTVSEAFCVYSGNAAIDSIINIEARKAAQYSIKYSVKIVNGKDIKVSPMDMCTILSNAIDNAIECCIKQEMRFIDIDISSQDDKIKIVIKNPSEYLPESENGIFITTKIDKINHGLGLKNIERKVKKYNGQVVKECKNNIFYLYITMNNMSFVPE